MIDMIDILYIYIYVYSLDHNVLCSVFDSVNLNYSSSSSNDTHCFGRSEEVSFEIQLPIIRCS